MFCIDLSVDAAVSQSSHMNTLEHARARTYTHTSWVVVSTRPQSGRPVAVVLWHSFDDEGCKLHDDETSGVVCIKPVAATDNGIVAWPSG